MLRCECIEIWLQDSAAVQGRTRWLWVVTCQESGCQYTLLTVTWVPAAVPLPRAPIMTRNPPGAVMEASLDRVGARSVLEVKANSRQSLMVTTAGGWGRQRPDWRTLGERRSLPMMILGHVSILVIRSSVLMPSMSATSFIEERSGEEEMLLSVSLIRSLLVSRRSENMIRSAQAEADTRPVIRGPLPISTTDLGFGKE